MRFVEEAKVQENGRHGTLMVDSERIGEIIDAWSASDERCQPANLIPVMSASGRTFLRLVQKCNEAPDRYFLIPAGVAIAAAITGYELIPTDKSGWLIVDMRQVRVKDGWIAFRFESIAERYSVVVMGLDGGVLNFDTIGDYDLWLINREHSDALPMPRWRNGNYDFPDAVWRELRIPDSDVEQPADNPFA